MILLKLTLSCWIWMMMAFINISFANQVSPVEKLQSYISALYYPTEYGLQDLYFEVEKQDLAEQLNSAKQFGSIKHVVFKVYWMINVEPDKSKLEIIVEGLPKGFDDLKVSLSSLVTSNLGFVVPKRFGQDLLKYQLSYYPDSINTLQGIDETGKMPINKFTLNFEKNILKTLTAYIPIGTQTIDFSVSKKSWSHGKLAIDSIKVKSIEGTQTITFTTSINYIVSNGFGLPKQIKVHTKSSMHTARDSADGAKESEKFDLYNLRNFKVNQKIALEHFQK